MQPSEAIDLRVATQGLSGPGFDQPESAVQRLTAMQSQDFPAAKWALGRRIPGSRDGEIQAAFDEGQFLRTHIMRPTWHFVAPSDIRWMQKLTSPHVKRIMASYLKKFELDSVLIGRATDTMVRAIQDAGPLSKPAIHHALAEQGFELDLHRLGYIIMEAELDAANAMRISRQLTEIDAALDRLHRDPARFGICEDTGRDIPFERLEVIPWARTCGQAGA